MSSVMMTVEPSVHQMYDSVAQKLGGKTFVVDETEATLSIYANLTEHLRNILAVDNSDSANYPVTLYQKYITSNNSNAVNGTFLIDADLGRDTEFGIYVEDDED